MDEQGFARGGVIPADRVLYDITSPHGCVPPIAPLPSGLTFTAPAAGAVTAAAEAIAAVIRERTGLSAHVLTGADIDALLASRDDCPHGEPLCGALPFLRCHRCASGDAG